MFNDHEMNLIEFDMLYDIGLGFYDHTGDEEDCDMCGYEAPRDEYNYDEDDEDHW